MGEMKFISEWAGRVRMARLAREAGEPMPDPVPPVDFNAEEIEWHLKLVAHWEGGLPPDDPEAKPVELKLEDDES